MRKITLKIISSLLVCVMICAILPVINVTAAGYDYVRPYIENLRIFPYYGATINGDTVNDASSNLRGIILDWDPVGSLAWSEIVISETPLCDSNGNPYNFSGTQFDLNNDAHKAAYSDIVDNNYRLYRNDPYGPDDTTNAYNVANQSMAFISTDSYFIRGNKLDPEQYPEQYKQVFKNESGKTYYFYIFVIGQDSSQGLNNVVSYGYVADCIEYTVANTIGIIPNGLSNTVKFALVQNDDPGSDENSWEYANGNWETASGFIYRWNSYDEIGDEAKASKLWYVSYSSANGYTVTDYKNGTTVSSSNGGVLNTSYCTFVDTDIAYDPENDTDGDGFEDYYYLIYQSNTASFLPVSGVIGESTIPGPDVNVEVLNTYYNTTSGQAVNAGFPQRLSLDASATTDSNYRSRYRWTVLNIYTNYVNTCQNEAQPNFDWTVYTDHTGANECGTFHHSNPLVTWGGRFGLPDTKLTDSSGATVTNGDGALVGNGASVTYDYNGNEVYDPTAVVFSFGADYNEAPLYIEKDQAFTNNNGTTVTDCATGTDLTRGVTYLFAFISGYEYQVGETPTGWDHAITQEEVNTGKNFVFGTTYCYYTVPFVSIAGRTEIDGTVTETGSWYTHYTYGNIPAVNNTPINVTVSWSALSFDLVKTWQPETHTYKYDWNSNEENGPYIKVQNNGLAAITAGFSFSTIDAFTPYVYGYFVYSPAENQWAMLPESNGNALDIDPKSVNTAYLQLAHKYGESNIDPDPPITQPDQPIGSVTVTINQKYEMIT